jgi:hypothetical protein
MKKLTIRNLQVAIVSLAVVNAMAATASIGIATARGSFRVDDSYVAGNATLFDGASIETGASTSELNLSKARVVVATETRGRVYQDRLILDRGRVQWSGSGYRTLAGEFQVVGADGASKALVSRKGETVEVASLSGTVNVLSSSGEMVMAVGAGNAYDFSPEPQGASPGDQDNKGSTKAKKVVKLSTGAKVAIVFGVGAAVAIPAAVIATRGSSR